MRVVVADDAVILREGLARLLEEAGFDVVGLAANADELIESAARRPCGLPSLVIAPVGPRIRCWRGPG